MARVNFQAENEKKNEVYTKEEAPEILDSLVREYLVNKDKEKQYKDAASIQNTQIKVMMNEFDIREYQSESGKVILSDRKSEDFNEPKLIEFLKERGIADGIIKTKEYVDYDALESAIYHSKIEGDNLKDMESCKDIKVTQVLRISKK